MDIIGTNNETSPVLHMDELSIRIVETLSRRPCTGEDIARMTGLQVNEVMK